MIIKIILSGIKDWDLLALHRNPDFELSWAFRQALKGYVKGRPVKIPLPDPVPDLTFQSGKKAQVSVSLNPETDQDAIDWISHIKKGFRGAAMRNILRNALEEPCLVGFMADASELTQPAAPKLQKNKPAAKKQNKPKQQPQQNNPHPTKSAAVKQLPKKEPEEFDIFSDDFANNF